jgi:cytoskeletal protein RodZ
LTIGVGPALRKARLSRGVTLEEAARDTRIRPEFLEALEEEDFERLLGDVYARGCLRSYATYLGLSADTVVSAYAKHLADPMPAPQVVFAQPEPVVGARRRPDNHRLFVMVAATVLVLAAAFGVLSTRSSAPPPAVLPSEAPLVAAAEEPGITVAIEAQQSVEATITIDNGDPRTYSLQPGEGRSFAADETLTVRLDHGASARVTVNGNDQGFPGKPARPWTGTFAYETGGSTPSPTG